MPCNVPLPSGAPEPGVSFCVPQRRVPRARTVSNVAPWPGVGSKAGRAARATANKAARRRIGGTPNGGCG